MKRLGINIYLKHLKFWFFLPYFKSISPYYFAKKSLAYSNIQRSFAYEKLSWAYTPFYINVSHFLQRLNFLLFPLLIWILTLVIGIITNHVFSQTIKINFMGQQNFNSILGKLHSHGAGFHSWDGLVFIYIAKHGYTFDLLTPFFPLLPFLMRFLHRYTQLSYATCGFLITNISFLFSLIILYQLVSDKLGQKIGQRTLWLLSMFPTALYFNSVYSESLTLLTTVSFFYCLERGYWFSAMISGFLASIAHTLGVIVAPIGLFFLWRQRKKISKKLFWIRFLSLVIIPIGLLGYMLFLDIHFSNPFIFLTIEKYWGRTATIPVLNIFQHLFYYFHHFNDFSARLLIQITNGMLTLWIVILAFIMMIFYRHNDIISSELKLFFILTLLASICSGTHHGSLESYGRFMVVLYPAFIVWAYLLENITLFIYTMVFQVTLKIILTGIFVSGVSAVGAA